MTQSPAPLPDHDPLTAGLDTMLCFDVYAANLAFGRFYQPLLEPLGLTYPQYIALRALWARDGMSVGEIGAALGLESSTLTPLIKRLEGAGLVSRARDPQDERRVRVHLTGAGRALQDRAACVPLAAAEQVGMSREEAAMLRALLRRLRGALEDGPENAAAG